MRVLRTAIVVVILALGGVLVASPASAQVNQLSIGQPKLGPLGASVVIPLSFSCDVGFNLAFGDVNVVQSSGHKLAQGSGSFENDFPGVPCNGAPQTITVVVSDFSSFAFKQGRASATADVFVYNPVTGDLVDTPAGPLNVRITK